MTKTMKTNARGEKKNFDTVDGMMPFAISVNTDGYEGDDAQTDIIIENDGAGVLHDVAVEINGEVQYFSNVKQLKFTTMGSLEREDLAEMLRWVADQLDV